MSNRSPFPSPPPELVEQWFNDSPIDRGLTLATQAARWGADQELEACVEWLQDPDLNVDTYKLCAARRPKPPSLKKQALALVNSNKPYLDDAAMDTIRRALEALND